MLRTNRANLLIGVLMILASGLAGCGVAAGQQVDSAGVVGTPGTATIVSTAMSHMTPTPSRSNIIGNGSVTVTVDASHYAVTDTIGVVINNASGGDISTADHQTNCKEVTLQREVNGAWQNQRPCPLLSPTRLVTLAPGSTPQPLAPGSTPWTPGVYRVAFAYFTGTDAGTTSSAGAGANPPTGQDSPIYSSSFTIA